MFRPVIAACLVTALAGLAAAAELNPAAVIYKLPDQIQWKGDPARGVEQAVMVGDPSKPGLYVVFTKWKAGNHFSHPHFHPTDRATPVVAETRWFGPGTKSVPDSSVPMPAGTFVTHYGKQVHFDGAKD